MARTRFDVGLGLRREFRNLLKVFAFEHKPHFEWIEIKGIFESQFFVRGDAAVLRALAQKANEALGGE
jgi:hypothetical protein